MTSKEILVPGARDVRATLDLPDGGAAEGKEGMEEGEGERGAGEADAVVVACPPHPEFGGNRSDTRLVALGEYLAERGVACLRFDYGEWDEGYGEREDARNALRWARERYERVGIFGFSFGTGAAALAAASVEPQPDAVSLLAPTARLAGDLDTVSALDGIEGPVQVVYGTRDDTVDWEPVVERARESGTEVVEFSADHFFVGQERKVAAEIGAWLVERLR